MKKLLLLLSFTCYAMYTNAQMSADEQKMQQAMMDYMQPGQMQQWLAKWNGNWNAEVTMWMQPDAPATKSTGTCKNEMILGGRYQQSWHTGQMMNMPFNGISTTGYDNARKIFMNTWVDNMGTGIMYGEGTWDETTKSIEFKSKGTDCTTGKEMFCRQIISYPNDNQHTMEMWVPDPKTGKEYKCMAITFTRAKK